MNSEHYAARGFEESGGSLPVAKRQRRRRHPAVLTIFFRNALQREGSGENGLLQIRLCAQRPLSSLGLAGVVFSRRVDLGSASVGPLLEPAHTPPRIHSNVKNHKVGQDIV